MLLACSNDPSETDPQPQEVQFPYPINMVDAEASYQTKALYYNLLNNQAGGIIFGQQNATFEGVGWQYEPNRSDIKDVCGDYPALYGWDLENVIKSLLGNSSIDPVRSSKIKQLVIEAYDRGGINTFSWHMPNYNTGDNFYDTTPAVSSILPGGEKNEIYTRNLRALADFFKSLLGSDGSLIPVIFRPFHEHTGDWFWWGADYCTPEEYIALWQYTVNYLRDEQGVHNIIYAYSPDRIEDLDDYTERYPGDQYVDILGIDNYWEFESLVRAPQAIAGLNKVVTLAEQKGKPAALTETGLDQLTIPDWFTRVLLDNIKADPQAQKIAYLMVWRNGNSGHFFGPYPGHESAEPFLDFYQDPLTVFESQLPQVYVVQ